MEDGASILILSDRGVDREHAAIPALLALAGVHHHLVRQGTRTRVGLVVESGEPREVHHFAVLIGYGAGAINPYLAFETLTDMIRQGLLTGVTPEEACGHYIKAVIKGVVKVMSKMGICTIDGYRGAQIFEALGLDSALVERYFTGTASRVGGAGLAVIAEETLMRHRAAFPQRGGGDAVLATGGQYQWRSDGEHHNFNPLTVHKLQVACRTGNYATYQEYSTLIDDPGNVAGHAAQSAGVCRAAAGAHRRGRVDRGDLQTLQDRRDVVRLHQPGGARGAGHRHEPDRREEQLRRGRRRSRPLHPERRTVICGPAPSSRSRPAGSASPAST